MKSGPFGDDSATTEAYRTERMRKMAETKVTYKVDGAAIETNDAILSGRQIRQAAGLSPASDHVLIKLGNGTGQSIGLDEPVDLQGEQFPCFVSFRNDRTYSFTLNERGFEWGAEEISVEDLREYGGVPDDHELILDSQRDRPIEDGGVVRLKPKGVERILTRPIKNICIEDQLIAWSERTITTEQIAELGGWDVTQGVIEVDADQNERTLSPGEIVKLRRGVSYGKKLCFKRGGHNDSPN